MPPSQAAGVTPSLSNSRDVESYFEDTTAVMLRPNIPRSRLQVPIPQCPGYTLFTMDGEYPKSAPLPPIELIMSTDAQGEGTWSRDEIYDDFGSELFLSRNSWTHLR